MQFNTASARSVTVPYGSILDTYTTVISGSKGTYIEVKNSTDVSINLKAVNTTNEEFILLLQPNDICRYKYPVIHCGDISVSRGSTAPTVGSLFIQSICDGEAY